jgi:hypothetical protein
LLRVSSIFFAENEKVNLSIHSSNLKSHGSSVGMAAGYGLDDRWVGVAAPVVLHIIQTGSRAHPASYTVGTGDSFTEGKAARA